MFSLTSINLHIPPWENIRKIGQSKLLSLTIFIPILGYMILFNEHVVHIFELSKDLFYDFATSTKRISDQQNHVSEGNRTRLFYFYFGFTFLGLGSLLYQIFCPSLIKDYGSDRIFIREEVSLMTEKRFRLVLSFLDQNGETSPIEIDDLLERHEASKKTSTLDVKQKEEAAAATDLMLMQWQSENWSLPIIRMAVFILYSLGFLVLAIPSIKIFLKVLAAFLR